MIYKYTVRREAFINVTIEADDEEAADDIYFEMCGNGEFNDRWRNEVLEVDEEVCEVKELRDDGWYTIYNAW